MQPEQGAEIAREIGARAFKECSALRGDGVDDVFEAATRASMLMREGVAGHGSSRQRRSSGAGYHGDSNSKACCVVC